MKKEIKISKEISLPKDAVTQTFAFIGRKGSGKTYLATMVAEQMLDLHGQVIIIDPVGNFWGLRVNADGKSKGKEIFVIGGDHGDVPLVPEAGARIARLLVEKGISAVLDVSGFRIGEHKRFAADFAEEFFHLKKSHRSPVHVFIEEAQKIIPQRVGPDEARMVGAFEQIVRLGRNYGIGCSLITQRPQSVNKEVLSQVECLCVLQVTGPHERKALEEWVQEVGADRTLIGELPGLAQGEGYVWSPSWLRIYERVHFSKKQTFDASATPEVGKKTRAASISAVDVELLKKDIADVVAQAEKDNPIALKKKIYQLEKELVGLDKKPTKNTPMGVSQWLEYGKKYKYDTFFTEKITKEVEKRMNIEFMAERDEFIKHINTMFKVIKTVGETVKDIKMPDLIDRKKRVLKYKEVLIDNVVSARPMFSKEAIKVAKKLSPQDGMTHAVDTDFMDTDGNKVKPMSKCARSILSYLYNVYPNEKSKPQLWIATGYAPGGGFDNGIAELTSQGFIFKTEKGFQGRGEHSLSELIDPSFDPSLEKWDSKLSLCSRKIFHLLLEDPNTGLTKQELAQSTGYALGGGFDNGIAALTNPKLIKKQDNKTYIINPEILDL